MRQKTKQRLLSGCLAGLVALSSTLTPIAADAATPPASNTYTRIGGVDQYATAALMAQKGWPGTTDNVVLSAGMNYSLVDALAAGPLAAKLNAPILLTDGGNSLNPAAKAELQRLQPKTVYITSGTAVIKPQAIEELKTLGITPVQLGGYDQYETSVNIAKELARQGAGFSRVVLAAGWLSPADALSVAPIAAAQEMPILTTTQGQLPTSVKAYLDSIKAQVKESYVVGGSAVVSDRVKGDLPGNVSRFSGQTKYDTNIQILRNFTKDYKNNQVYVANGETLVDALAGVPLAASAQAPLLLVNRQLENATKTFVKLNLSTAKMIALGGEAVVPSAGMNTITSNIPYSVNNTKAGAADAAKPIKLTDSVQISGDNITLENANLDYSVYVNGDNVTLSNLKVLGTVFLDPGDNGSATLNDVSASKIVILSGAKDSIHLKNTSAEVLTVDSNSETRIESNGTTAIGNTVARSFAVLDVKSGSLGEVTILSTPGQSPIVELRGAFTQPVVLHNQAQVHLTASAVIKDLLTLGKASLIVDLGANVSSFDKRGNTVTITGSGAKAFQPPTPPATPTPPTTPTDPTTPTAPTTPASVKVSNLRVITNPANSLGTFDNGEEIDLSDLDDSDKVIGFAVTADQDCTLQFKVFSDVQNISLRAEQERIVTVGDLILGTSVPGGINLETFRALYQNTKTKTLQGKLLIEGNVVGTLTVKLRFLD
ncbi:cell wall-binding repeat-containing protein [Desulfosporosinus sp.]|uniref:cell wall-binding repeat-containing protein n=1 Tax=Desulfosporosinus sp. TaxID=157907 RepID=UPI0025BBC55A|nr:cell wall-binding repeat-containing protein [Desulfosporosinus sp.]MBC2722193.1 cell wall-binding repeat-containing protein [Desulfosporosinus sp.]MBC2726047.1 cell wall-binding repeat-containing protein [Desulfosporosinus sp.]